jgi:GNAT superfamily N-acetyltransferase
VRWLLAPGHAAALQAARMLWDQVDCWRESWFEFAMTDKYQVERTKTAEGTEISILSPASHALVASVLVTVDNNVRLTVYAPRLADTVERNERRDLYARLIAESELIALGAGCGYMEAKPSTATPGHEEWGSALEQHGFTLTAEKAALQRSPERSDLSPALAASVASADQYSRRELERLFASCSLGTLDRSDAGIVVDVPLNFAALVPADKTRNSTSAWVARVENVPVGMVVVELTAAAAWIAFVGVAEQFRRQSIGHGLLQVGIREAAASGRTAVRALIDIGNEPSLRLHRKAGFGQSIGTFRIYQRRLIGAA